MLRYLYRCTKAKDKKISMLCIGMFYLLSCNDAMVRSRIPFLLDSEVIYRQPVGKFPVSCCSYENLRLEAPYIHFFREPEDMEQKKYWSFVIKSNADPTIKYGYIKAPDNGKIRISAIWDIYEIYDHTPLRINDMELYIGNKLERTINREDLAPTNSKYTHYKSHIIEEDGIYVKKGDTIGFKEVGNDPRNACLSKIRELFIFFEAETDENRKIVEDTDQE